jgi:hypothetical protein
MSASTIGKLTRKARIALYDVWVLLVQQYGFYNLF